MNRRRLLAAACVGLIALSPARSWARDQIVNIAGAKVSTLVVFWDEVPGATGYEIVVDGQVLSTVARNKRSARVEVGRVNTIEITDIPARSLVQAIDFQQIEG